MSDKITIPKKLFKQLDLFIYTQCERCNLHLQNAASIRRNNKNFEWIKEFSIKHFISRIKRATDLESQEVFEAQKLAREYIGEKCHVFFATCVDGRNMPSIMFSKPPHVGGVLRTPAGTINGFMLGQNPDKVFIDHDSFVVKKIISLLREKAGGTVFYSLDSHIGCAARTQIHETEGGNQHDSGLRSDIINKMMTARGMVELQKELVAKGENVAKIIPTFFTYDPRNGGILTGLEMHTDSEDVAKEGFTEEKLEKLASEGLILRSIDFFRNPDVIRLIENEVKPNSADFRNNYPVSLLNNWKAIQNLFGSGDGTVYLLILNKLRDIYHQRSEVKRHGDLSHKISQEVLEHKAKFILRNLVTRFSIAGTSDKWPYNEHKEEMIVITDGGYAPFPSIDAFAVFSKDLNSLVLNTKLTIDLLRSFRRTRKIKNPIGEIEMSEHEFSSAPIFISNKAILKDLSEESFDNLTDVDINSIFSTIKWDSSEVLAWRKSDIANKILSIVDSKTVKIEMSGTLRFVDAVYELFDRMRILMKDKQFRQMIINGNIVIFNTIVNRNRMPKIIINIAV